VSFACPPSLMTSEGWRERSCGKTNGRDQRTYQLCIMTSRVRRLLIRPSTQNQNLTGLGGLDRGWFATVSPVRIAESITKQTSRFVQSVVVAVAFHLLRSGSVPPRCVRNVLLFLDGQLYAARQQVPEIRAIGRVRAAEDFRIEDFLARLLQHPLMHRYCLSGMRRDLQFGLQLGIPELK
jgi:hypothetical protein